ncbi:hypothetical protein DMN91_001644 [Ooceraea biroi]|uniref:Uncharacterized protein n=1 Tax=Ooceraea biroi TaxID=2015173 RepID=A0A3L8E0B4_OOCBI|nr:hypothetical protein DMN91_001644 [Ooceraea biroi]
MVRIGSVLYTVTLTSLAFFLCTEMNSVSGSHNDKELAPNNSDIDVVRPWLRPCGSGVVTMLKKPLQRHNAHKVLKRVRTQLRVAQNHFRKDLKDIFEIYSKHFYKVLKRQYNMPWLPCMQLEWYYNNVSCLPKNQKAERALPQLHDALQRFAITFYSLQKYNLQSDIESAVTMIRRNEIIDGMHNEILRLLCEVETAIVNLGLKMPRTRTERVINKKNWQEKGDLTRMLIQDWGVLKVYRIFLNDWMTVFRNATKKGTGRCVHIKSLFRNMKNRGKSTKETNNPKKPKIVEPMRPDLAMIDDYSLQNSSSPLLGQTSFLPAKPLKEPQTNGLKKEPQRNGKKRKHKKGEKEELI